MPTIVPASTAAAVMKSATCRPELKTMPIEKSRFPRQAMRTADRCSAMLPRAGTMIRPTNVSPMPVSWIVGSIAFDEHLREHAGRDGGHGEHDSAARFDQRGSLSLSSSCGWLSEW